MFYIPDKKNNSEYEYTCLQYGNCCREGYYVPVNLDDLRVWKSHSKQHFHKRLHIDPRTLSIVGINTNFGRIRSHWGGDFISKIEQEPNIVKTVYNRDEMRKLYKFAFDHHELRGNGIHRLHPVLGDIYHFPPKYDFD